MSQEAAAGPAAFDKNLVGTDAPLSGTSSRKRGRENVLAYTRYVDFIAELRGLTTEEVAQATYDNARKVFGL